MQLNKMTAISNKYEPGTVLRVTCKNTGKSIEVTVISGESEQWLELGAIPNLKLGYPKKISVKVLSLPIN